MSGDKRQGGPPPRAGCLPHPRPTKDTEGQVQAEAPSGRQLHLVVVQGAVGKHALLDGRLHGPLQTQGWSVVGPGPDPSWGTVLPPACHALSPRPHQARCSRRIWLSQAGDGSHLLCF